MNIVAGKSLKAILEATFLGSMKTSFDVETFIWKNKLFNIMCTCSTLSHS